MTGRVKPALRVRGSKDFQACLEALDRDSDEYRAVDEVLSVLKANVSAGMPVPRDRWPKVYMRRYGLNNLYKIDIKGGRRLTYTIVAEDAGCSVIVLEYFCSHKDYEVRFKY